MYLEQDLDLNHYHRTKKEYLAVVRGHVNVGKWHVSIDSLIPDGPVGIPMGVSGEEGSHFCNKKGKVDKGSDKGGTRECTKGNEWQQLAMKEALTPHYQVIRFI